MSFLIASAHVDIEARTQKAISNITSLITKLVSVGPAAGGAATVVAGALGGLTAATVAAGAAAGAFALASKPQIDAMNEASGAAEKLMAARETEARKKAVADKLSAQGSDLAGKAVKAYNTARLATADAEEAYKRATAGMPQHTREAALALAGLKREHEEWSENLASSTMPVFTKGINVLRDILPQLTPLVKTASSAFSDMMDDLGEGVNSGGFKAFMTRLNEAAKESLPNLIRGFGQFFKGIGGIIDAFLPTAGKASDKFADMMTSFARWAQSLKSSDDFKGFMTFVSENGPKLVDTLGNLATTAQKLWQAFAPLASIQLTLFAELTEFISKLPPPVILALAAALVTLKLALIGFQIYTTLAAAGMAPLIASTWAWTAALLANPMTWIVVGIIALVAAIVLIATKTDWFQRLWSAAWGWIKSAWDTTWSGLKAGWNAMGNFFTQTIPGWLTSLKNWFVSKWNEIRTKVSEVLHAVRERVSSIWSSIFNTVRDKVTGIVSRVRDGFNSARSFVSDIGSQIVSAVRNAFSSMVNAVRGKVSEAVTKVKNFKSSVVSFFAGAGSWLVSAGRSIISGFINGIKSMGGAAKSAAKSVLSGVRNLFPFSPAKEGPFSGDGWTEISGAALMEGLAQGIESRTARVTTAMNTALAAASRTITKVADTSRNKAIQELMQRVKSGGHVWEDLSFKGMSSNMGKHNDSIADQFWKGLAGKADWSTMDRDFIANRLQGMLTTTTVAAPVATAAPASVIQINELNVTVEGAFDLTKPDQNKAAAQLLAKNLSTALRDYERERR